MKRNSIRNVKGKFVKVPVDPNAKTRICWCCKNEKHLDLFGNDKTGILGKKGKCKKCESDATNRYNKRNRDKVRRVGRRIALRRFGLTLEAYDALFDAQGRACAICRTTESGGRSGTFPVDHCHTSGAVRAILCNNCNLLLGHANDDVSLLEKAMAYLDGYQMVTSRNAIKKNPAAVTE